MAMEEVSVAMAAAMADLRTARDVIEPSLFCRGVPRILLSSEALRGLCVTETAGRRGSRWMAGRRNPTPDQPAL